MVDFVKTMIESFPSEWSKSIHTIQWEYICH